MGRKGFTPLYTLEGAWIMCHNVGSSIPQIAGRVFGPEGAVAYQLAGRPHDQLPVYGFQTREDAFDAAERELTTLNTKDIA